MEDNNPRGKKTKKEMSILLGWIRRFNKWMTPNKLGWIFAGDTIICIYAILVTGFSWPPALMGVLTFFIAVILWNRSDMQRLN